MLKNNRRRTQYKILALLEGKQRGLWGRLLYFFIIVLILANTFTVTFFSLDALDTEYEKHILYLEILCIVIFSYEYGLRLWSCTVLPRYRHPLKGRLRFMLAPLVLIDLIVLIPFYLPIFCPEFVILHSLVFARLFRILRFLRIFKLLRYSRSAMILAKVFYTKREELLITIIMASLILIVVSNLVYLAEHQAQSEKFATVPDALWWGIVTLSTVGYGDMYPITPLGKILGTIISVLGIGVFALPAGILAAGFQEEMHRQTHVDIHECPHCHKQILPSELRTQSSRKEEDKGMQL
ncbi:ion transporter [Candidatus Albibeggiatoa sp. nov. NOAA]|uniref:ion transporter n=1 Tax=Candidatus Albibeggiatoa sp. nov. NOAA TaxID=3162724 RepID=UPI0032FBDDC6|nr:ion transporter [Thiotrichaceae bacterium]